MQKTLFSCLEGFYQKTWPGLSERPCVLTTFDLAVTVDCGTEMALIQFCSLEVTRISQQYSKMSSREVKNMCVLCSDNV